MVVASDFGRYFLTFSLIVSMGHVEKWPFSIALMKVEVDGLKQALWRKLTVSAVVPAGMTLLTCSVVLSVLMMFSSSLTRHRPVLCGSRYPSRMV
jgi:hypothetical protein